MGALDTSNGSTAHCTLHGGTFKILYAHRTASLDPPPPEAAPATVRRPHCGQEFSATAEHSVMTMDCTNCQREFPIALAPPVLTCSRHGNVPATTVCNRCGTYLCATCAFFDKRSGSLSPNCASAPVVAQPRQAGVAPRKCSMHPKMRAVGSCSGCGVAVCGTCAFDFPGGVRLCPRCAAK